MSSPHADKTPVTLGDYASNPYGAMAKQAIQDTRALLSAIPQASAFNAKLCDLLAPVTPKVIAQRCELLRDLAPKR